MCHGWKAQTKKIASVSHAATSIARSISEGSWTFLVSGSRKRKKKTRGNCRQITGAGWRNPACQKPAADGHDKRRTSWIIASLALLCQPAWTDVICECGLVCVQGYGGGVCPARVFGQCPERRRKRVPTKRTTADDAIVLFDSAARAGLTGGKSV